MTPHHRLLRYIIIGVTMVVVLFLLPDCPGDRRMPEAGGRTMGTTWRLVLARGDAETARRLVQARLNELEALFTNWRPDSAVSRFNTSRSTAWQEVPRELAEVVKYAREVSRETGGAFDVTAGPLIDLWGFGAKGRVNAAPGDEAIAMAKQRCGWEKLEVDVGSDPPKLRKTAPDLELNVSALVEGYAVDDVVRRLREAGFPDFLLEVGGELYASGTRWDGQPWEVGVQQPGLDRREVAGSLPLTDRALATSGTYQQYFESGGQRYAHVLDARTGRPVAHDGVSVSVVHASCLTADAWATALLILGPEEGRKAAERLEIDALIIRASGNGHDPGE